jgi:hypothetical protein
VTAERQGLEAQAEAILAEARERADQRRATNPAAASIIMHYARLRAARALAGGRRVQFSRDMLDLDGNPRPTTRRACLRCRKDFESTGPGNRLCRDCQMKAADASPYAV